MRGDGCFRGTEVTPMRIVATRSSTSMRPALSAVPSPLYAIQFFKFIIGGKLCRINVSGKIQVTESLSLVAVKNFI